MKGILKTRNFDSIKKLSLKRAAGKQKQLYHRMSKITTSILFLEDHKMLTPEMLWNILEIYLNYQIESAKLQYVIYHRRGTSFLKEFSERGMKNYYENINVSSHRMVSNIPYEISDKYRNIILKMQKEHETIS